MTKPQSFQFPELIEFEGASLLNLRSALHAQFHRRQYDLVNAADKTKLSISEALMQAWNAQIELEVDANRKEGDSATTQRMVEKDRERDSHVTTLFQMIEAQRSCVIKDFQEAYLTLHNVIRPYSGLQNEGNDEETMHIVGLEKDLAKHAAETAKLGLTPIITALHTANSEYETLRKQRLNNTVATELPETKQIRLRNDKFFKLVCRYIEAAHLLATTEPDKQAMVELASRMNQVTKEIKTSHNESEAQRQSAAADEHAKLQALLQPLFGILELERQLPAGSIALTGHKRTVNKKLRYELSVAGSDELLWAEVRNDKLVVVRTPASAAKATSSRASKKNTTTKPKPSDGHTAGESPQNHGEMHVEKHD